MSTIDAGSIKPLKMPENYDFSQRRVNWSNYKRDYLLRSDAVWEKYKLFSYFYSVYKAEQVHHEEGQYYDVSFEYAFERYRDKDGKDDILKKLGASDETVAHLPQYCNGGHWQFDHGPALFKPKVTTQFVGDKTKDQSFLCMLKFHKFMRCNEKSQIKLTEANIFNSTFYEYKCFEELNELFDVCITYHFKVLFEMYYFRVYNNYFKPHSQHRIFRAKDMFYSPDGSKKLYY